MKVKNIIFDMDGTLLDSMEIWDRLFILYLESKGITPPDDIREIVRPMSQLQAAEYFKSEFKIPDSIEIIKEDMYVFLGDWYSEKVTAKKGLLNFLEHLKDSGVKMCIATSTPRKYANMGLEHTGISTYFKNIYCTDEIGIFKDDPQFYDFVARQEGFKKCETLVFEDACFAVHSAAAAGFKVIGIYDESAKASTEEIKRLCDKFIYDFEDKVLNDYFL